MMRDARRKPGAPPFDPKIMVCLLLNVYGVGVLSSREMAWTCERHLACIAIVDKHRPDLNHTSMRYVSLGNPVGG